MAFLHTNDVIELLQERLASLTLKTTESQANPGDKLFQRVGAFGANRLVAAMKAVFASEQRVCFIVPGGDRYGGNRDAVMLRSVRSTRIALLIADKAFDAGKTDALTGGPANIGILAMKDRVIDDLVTNKFSLADFVVEPSEGEPLVISDTDKQSGNLGRECWLQWLGCYAGEARIGVP